MTTTTETKKAVWATRIRAARGETSQEAFAAKVGVSVQTISRWERGKYEPRYSGAVKLSKATGKSAAYFLGEEDAEEEQQRIADAAVALLADAFAGLAEQTKLARRMAAERVPA